MECRPISGVVGFFFPGSFSHPSCLKFEGRLQGPEEW